MLTELSSNPIPGRRREQGLSSSLVLGVGEHARMCEFYMCVEVIREL